MRMEKFICMPLLIVLYVFWGVGCHKKGKTKCETACDIAEACGILPSALGSGSNSKENCAARCESSKDPSAMLNCLSDDIFSYGSLDESHAWCSEDDGEGPCAEVAECLMGVFGSADGLGMGALEIVPVYGDDVDPDGGLSGALEAGSEMGCHPSGCSTTECESGEIDGCYVMTCNGSFTEEDSNRMCDQLHGTMVEYSASCGDQCVLNDPIECVQALSEPVVISGILPGPARIDMRLYGAVTEVADGGVDAGAAAETRTFCLVFHGPETLVASGETRRVAVPLPDLEWAGRHLMDPEAWVYHCEGDELTCFDTLDNDGDSLTDCVDPDCFEICSELSNESGRSIFFPF